VAPLSTGALTGAGVAASSDPAKNKAIHRIEGFMARSLENLPVSPCRRGERTQRTKDSPSGGD
jgi:hypothetical protein